MRSISGRRAAQQARGRRLQGAFAPRSRPSVGSGQPQSTGADVNRNSFLYLGKGFLKENSISLRAQRGGRSRGSGRRSARSRSPQRAGGGGRSGRYGRPRRPARPESSRTSGI